MAVRGTRTLRLQAALRGNPLSGAEAAPGEAGDAGGRLAPETAARDDAGDAGGRRNGVAIAPFLLVSLGPSAGSSNA